MFRNEIFVSQVAKARGIEAEIKKDVARSILVILETQTLMLIETAAKYARHFRKEEIEFSDLECALKELGSRVTLADAEDSFVRHDNSFIRKDFIVEKPEEYLSRQLGRLGRLASKPEVKGRWLYLEGRVPTTEDNLRVKTLDELRELRSKEIEEQNNKFNIIRDRQCSLLTKEQEDFLQRLLGAEPAQLGLAARSYDLSTLLPFLLHHLLSAEVSERGVDLMLALLANPHLAPQF
jgi:histone H3/H4